LKLSILALCAVALISCNDAPAPVEETILQPQKVDAPQSSGSTLKGEYVLTPAQDDYAVAGEARQEIRFDDEGTFTRQRFSDESGTEEGAYFISTANELVFFVERVNDAQLEWAVMERYLILERDDLRLKLQADRAGAFILEKK
jgi:hypothetical protein